jgi:hypothetical protein
MKPFTPKRDIKTFETRTKNNTFMHGIGVLLEPLNTVTFQKHGHLIVINHIQVDGENHYTLFSQKEQREFETKCWVVNAFYKPGNNSEQIPA